MHATGDETRAIRAWRQQGGMRAAVVIEAVAIEHDCDDYGESDGCGSCTRVGIDAQAH